MRKIESIQKKYTLVIPVLFVMSAIFGGCASNLTGYYKSLRTKIDSGDYEEAAKFVDKSKSKYGSSNILMYYLDSGVATHFAKDYNTSSKKFELAKRKFEEYYQKSITAGAASMIFNDSTMPYYGQDFERVHISVFEALDCILSGHSNEAVVEARQINTLFKTLETEKNCKNFYKDDGFIRYFMGLVYENAGYTDDARISYFKALKAYKNGLSEVSTPKELIDDAYTSALISGMESRAAEIKKEYPKACKRVIPSNYGECIVVDYNGFVPEKIDNVFEFALLDIWPYVEVAQAVDSQEQEDFNKAKSVGLSIFAKDYVKVAFPEYKDFENSVVAFKVQSCQQEVKGAVVQDIGKIAKACLKNNIRKIYEKTLARVAVKYIIGRVISNKISDEVGKNCGTLSQISFNTYNSLSETSDKRAWNTLPDKILMARFCLPAGTHALKIDFLGKHGEVLDSCSAEVDVKAGKKNFVAVRSSRI
ncbi:hypothetical protein AGMMS50222_00730 [Endomicrobiia bacterium]|nr:hypothetical protein AGMMS49556_01780 [Endomicrobiia bacterium]GHT73361.1 hypothetical protein AGMMS50222_00730 [Endomicrobiia bacterium]